GFPLARAVADAYEAHPGSRGMVWMRHGLMAWGADARAAYETTIMIVTRAEEFIRRRRVRATGSPVKTTPAKALARTRTRAPLLRGALAAPTGDADRPHRRVVVVPLVTPEVLAFVD